MRRWIFALAAFGLLVQLTGCATERYTRPQTEDVQRGMASWYGPKFHGRPTASGETYDMHQLTAAHKELPLHTIVEVRNLDNDRSVRVRINDRGPYVRGRVLDLSFAAAQELGMVDVGLARVEIRVVEVGHGRPGLTRFTRYTVQVGAFRDLDNARAARDKLHAASFAEAAITSAKDLHRVRLGNFADKAEAEALRRRLRSRGFDAVVLPLS